MALTQSIAANFGQGGSKITDQGDGGLKAILTELQSAVNTLQTSVGSLQTSMAAAQNLEFATVTGAAAATNIAVTGLTADDTVLHVINLTDLADVYLAGLAVSAGNFQITASTESKKLLVIWQVG